MFSDFNLDERLSFFYAKHRLSIPLKKHLVRVYSHLAAFITLFLATCYFGQTSTLLRVDPFLCLFATLGLSAYLAFSAHSRSGYRLLALCALAFFSAAAVSPVLAEVRLLDPELFASAAVSSLLLFVSLSATALLAEERSFFFLGSFLSTGTLVLLFGTLFGKFSFVLYAGLLLFCGHVLLDTQVIAEKFERFGDDDAVAHAAELGLDFAAVFVRVLLIMANRRKKKEKRTRD